MKQRRSDRRTAAGAVTAILALTWAGASCSGMPDLPKMVEGDWQPPVLHSVRAAGVTRVEMGFDEPVELRELAVDPPVELAGARGEGAALMLDFAEPLAAGAEYWMDATVEDHSGNISSLLVSVYGHNPALPPVLINEVICEGSGSRPDWVELRTLEAGNLGGMTLYEGSPGIWDSRFVFPAMEVPAGALLVVHFNASGDSAEQNELRDGTASGGASSSDTGWDMWVSGGDGIPNSTGALTLTRNPGGEVMDALLYTTKFYDAGDELRGFGLASQVAIMDELAALGVWQISGQRLIPDDLLNPEDSTATRSINRGAGPDTDTPADWHIGPTSSASPGLPNTSEVYEG